jgi:hypothetical protein
MRVLAKAFNDRAISGHESGCTDSGFPTASGGDQEHGLGQFLEVQSVIHTATRSVAKFVNEHVKNAGGIGQCGTDENFIVAVSTASVSPTFANCTTALGIRG